MKSVKLQRDQYWHAGIVAIAIWLPLLVMAPLVFLQAKERADGEATVTAVAIQRQIDTMLGVVFANTGKAAAMAGRPCRQVLAELTRLTLLSPYFRSLALIRDGNKEYCSSALGMIDDLPLAQGFPPLSELPPGRGITPTATTLLVRDRPAVLVSEHTANHTGVIAVIDGQYLLDIQAAASYNRQFEVQILQTDSQRQLPGGAPVQTPAGPAFRHSDASVRSSQFPVEVRVAVEPALVATYRRDLWIHYAPFLALAALLSGYVAHRFCKRRLSLVTEIRRGMRQNEFHMVYQPVIRLATGECSGVEALVRWHRPGQDSIRPDIFIPLAEDSGLIAELTRHIFDLVVADMPQLRLGPQDHLGINVSGSHLATPAFVGDVERLMRALGPQAPLLVLEMTEREAVPDDEQAQRNIRQLRGEGVLWALDDFGTGQSALSYLEQLHADFIKIDRSFVKGADTESVNAVVLETIITLAQRLKLDLIAEGIETPAQLAYLRQHGVQWGQGYLFAAPLRAAELAAWRNSRTARPDTLGACATPA
ncbi:diguanylate phosphodiesterase [Burkholderia sp. lig30]|uniref:EAL domain-containing protein n=1 Tax=Burkholderia sp. lig30 TaxID=1192124 RepID=UPI000461A3E7|nr:EAL domain-containing protein [Burkholderia sp. lig30]KDB09298.1 diguanylate phosphodiesterase [Burkholderia sp. lig30]